MNKVFPRLFQITESGCIAQKTISDLGLDSWLSKNAQKIISSGCCFSEAQLRQQCFHELSIENNICSLEKVVSAAYQYQRLQSITVESKLQECLRILFLSRAFLDIYDSAYSLTRIPLFGKVISMFKTFLNDVPEIRNDMKQCFQVLQKNCQFSFTLNVERNSSYSVLKTFYAVPGSHKQNVKKRHLVLQKELFYEFFNREPICSEIAYFSQKYSMAFPTGIDAFISDCLFLLEMKRHEKKILELGGNICYPKFSENTYRFDNGYNYFERIKEGDIGIYNSFNLRTNITVVKGINNGGKTTFLKLVGIIGLLGSAGCFVPCKNATIPYFSSVQTFFANIEDFSEGRYFYERNQIEGLIHAANSRTLLLMNEPYSSTNQSNAEVALKETIELLYEIDCRSIIVTHFKIPTELCYTILHAEVDQNGNPTHRILEYRKQESSFTRRILEKYHMYNLTKTIIKEEV